MNKIIKLKVKNNMHNPLKIDKRYKRRKYYRINSNGKIQFSDEYDEVRGFIGRTEKIADE